MSLSASDCKPTFWTQKFLELTAKNFNLWEARLRAHLRPISAEWTLEEPDPEEEETATQKAIRINVLSLMQNNLDDTHLALGAKAQAPERLFTLLRGQHRPNTSASRFDAKISFFALRHEGFSNVVAYAKHLESEAIEINRMAPPDNPLISIDDLILTLRKSTKSEYRTVWGHFDGLPDELQTFEEAVVRLQAYEFEYGKKQESRNKIF